MWELTIFRRLVPAFIFVILGFIFYIGTKYVINGLYAGACNSGMDTSTWVLAPWFFGLMGIIVVWAYLLKGWLIVQGRHPTGLEEHRPKARKRTKVTPINFPLGPFGP